MLDDSQNYFDKLKLLPDGILERVTTSLHQIFIIKQGTQIQMYFAETDDASFPPKLSGIMSRIDVSDPLNLIGRYTQALILFLFWQPSPKSVAFLGFAGGRVPYVLKNCFPNLIIDSVDFEGATGTLAQKYFGIKFSESFKLIIQDANDFLTKNNNFYDAMIVDLFRGSGYMEDQFKSEDFYALCSKRLSSDGILAINFCETENVIQEQLKILKKLFKQVCLYQDDIANVIIASKNIILSPVERMKIAQNLNDKFHFHFPFLDRAAKIINID